MANIFSYHLFSNVVTHVMFCIVFSEYHLSLKALVRSLFRDKNLQRSIREGLHGVN